MIRSIYIDAQGKKTHSLSLDDMRQALKDPNGLLWVSLEQPTNEEATQVLVDLFQFHPLSVEDSLNYGYQTPKVDDYGQYIFIIFHALRTNADYAELETMEINLFIGMNFLVTLYLDPQMPPIDTLWNRVQKDERLVQNGSDFLSYGLFDIIVDEYLPVLDRLDDEIEWLEDQVMEKPKPATLERILTLKHTLMALRRIMSPQREVMNRLSRDQFPMIDRHSQLYFRDIYDHLVRFQDLTESLRDIIAGAMDIYLNSISLRLNEVMKALTIVSTIFLPLSFLSGVFGMNFEHFPILEWRYGMTVFWAICLLTSGGMLYFFRRRGWF